MFLRYHHDDGQRKSQLLEYHRTIVQNIYIATPSLPSLYSHGVNRQTPVCQNEYGERERKDVCTMIHKTVHHDSTPLHAGESCNVLPPNDSLILSTPRASTHYQHHLREPPNTLHQEKVIGNVQSTCVPYI